MLGLILNPVSRKAILLLLVLASLWGAFAFVKHQGYVAGYAAMKGQWDSEKADLALAALAKERENAQKEQVQAVEAAAIQDELDKVEADHAKALADLFANDDVRLRQASERAARYRRWAEGSASERQRLASDAAGLDLAVSEGQRLVRELLATLAERESQLRALGKQIKSDRKLMGVTE